MSAGSGMGRGGFWPPGSVGVAGVEGAGTGVPAGDELAGGAAPPALPVLPVGVTLGVPQAARSTTSKSGAVSRAARLNIVVPPFRRSATGRRGSWRDWWVYLVNAREGRKF